MSLTEKTFRHRQLYGVYGETEQSLWVGSTNEKNLLCYERVNKTRRPELDFSVTEYRFARADIATRSWRYVRPNPLPDIQNARALLNAYDTGSPAFKARLLADRGSGAFSYLRKFISEWDRNNTLYSGDTGFTPAGIACNVVNSTQTVVYGADEVGYVSAVVPPDKGGNGVRAESIKPTESITFVTINKLSASSKIEDITTDGRIVYVLLSDNSTGSPRCSVQAFLGGAADTL